MKRMGSLHNHN